MLLRHLVTTWVRQAAQQTLRDAVEAQARAPDRETGDASEPANPPPPPAQIVCVYALGAEAGGFVDLLQGCVTSRCPTFVEHAGELGHQRVAILETGVGRAAAARATTDAIALHRPQWVVSAGFAGALHEDLQRGHMLMPEEIVDIHGQCLTVGLKLGATSPGLHTGRLLTVDELIRTQAEKRRLGAEHRALACDMETMAVAQVCHEQKVRFLSVRIVSDAIDDELPKEIERLMEQKSVASKLGAATGAIFNRPSSVKDMWQLKEQALRSSDRLAKFLASTIAQLPV